MTRRPRSSAGSRGGWWPPPPAARGPALSGARGGSRFGASWWGRAWIEALEQRARLDPNRLPRGRTYARSGAVGELVAEPGAVRAPVQGSRAVPYRVHLRVRQFDDSEWERVLASLAGRAAHAAALLDGELDPGVLAELERVGIHLLPAAGELSPTCSCPDWATPCKHAAAVCYLVADRMDADPFTILLLRGRSRDQVLATVRRLRAGGDATAPAASSEMESADAGVEARALFHAGRDPKGTPPTPLPAPPLPPARPGLPASLAIDPPATAPVSSADLSTLAADAARRAWQLCHGSGDGGLSLDVDSDLARIASTWLGRSDFDALARRAGMAPRALMRRALAWRAGGAAALEVLDGPPWRPPPEDVEEGAAALRTVAAGVAVRGDRVTGAAAAVQLRLGRDGLWYRLVRRAGQWEIHQPPSADPSTAVMSEA